MKLFFATKGRHLTKCQCALRPKIVSRSHGSRFPNFVSFERALWPRGWWDRHPGILNPPRVQNEIFKIYKIVKKTKKDMNKELKLVSKSFQRSLPALTPIACLLQVNNRKNNVQPIVSVLELRSCTWIHKFACCMPRK